MAGVRRIIPAYAGSTVVAGGSELLLRDHPRIRGEHGNFTAHFATADGSSPHTRGALENDWIIAKGGRIIPAYAGSTALARIRPVWYSDHPRIRGEHSMTVTSIRSTDGSSPHTRGALEALDLAEHVMRIIPAYAGSTRWRAFLPRAPQDHPRIRGEHGNFTFKADSRDGSSPHTRGAPPTNGGGLHGGRIIPAYAGSTRISQDPDGASRDHPRIRGEHRYGGAAVPPAVGSSPHTRGALCSGCSCAAPARIIPAYAGSTRISILRR